LRQLGARVVDPAGGWESDVRSTARLFPMRAHRFAMGRLFKANGFVRFDSER
jgi:hypothetical protein